MDYQIVANSTDDIKHNTSARKTAIKYIVIHYTADSGATGANEVAYFSKKSTRRASADYFVNFDGVIYQYNNRVAERYSWHCGGGKLNKHGIMYGIVKNANSVSIEMCCTINADGTYSITDETYNATVWLARLIRYICSIPTGRVYRHFDVTGKMCPNVKGFLPPNESVWQKMRAAIDDVSQDTSASIAPEVFKVNTNYKVTARRGLKVRAGHSIAAGVKKVYPYGTVFTCKDIYHGTDGRTWLRTPSGWICGIDVDGSKYAG